MRFGKILLFLSMLVAAMTVSTTAHAQNGIYVDFTGAKVSAQTTSWLYGPTVGLYMDRMHYGVLSTGVDIRGEFLGHDGVSLNSGLIGPRLALRPRALPISPYVEALIGVGHTSVKQGNNTTSSDTNFQYQFLAGVDYTLVPKLDWRVIEFSYGGLSVLNGSLNPKTLSTGLVLRF